MSRYDDDDDSVLKAMITRPEASPAPPAASADTADPEPAPTTSEPRASTATRKQPAKKTASAGRTQPAARPAPAGEELPPPPQANPQLLRTQYNTKLEVDLFRRWEAFVAQYNTTKQGATEAALAEYMDRRGFTAEVHEAGRQKRAS